MSLMQHIEENAEHLLRVLKHMMQVEQNMYGTTLDVTQKIHDALETHLAPAEPTPVVEAPVVAEVVEAAPVVDAPVATKSGK